MKWFARLIVIVSAVLPFFCYSLELGPLVHEITTGNRNNRAKITLSNNATSQQFIDVSVNRLIFDGAGYGFQPVSDKELLVFPPAFRLDPGASQSVMVIWSGEVQLPASRSYSVKFTAINDSALTGKDAIGIEINYNVIVHVSSARLVADIALGPIRVSKSGDGVQFSVENRGSKYSKLSNFDLMLKSSHTNQDHRISARTIVSEGFDTFIPANHTVDITIPYASLPAQDIDQIVLVEKVNE